MHKKHDCNLCPLSLDKGHRQGNCKLGYDCEGHICNAHVCPYYKAYKEGIKHSHRCRHGKTKFCIGAIIHVGIHILFHVVLELVIHLIGGHH